MTDCPNATVRDRLPDLVHGAVDAPTRAALEAHLAGCAACTSELALLRDARAVLSGAPQVDVARIVAALPRPGGARPRLVQFPSPAERDRRDGRWRTSVRGGLAAAAAVAVAIGLGSFAARDRDAGSAAAVVALADPADRASAGQAADAAPLLVVNTAGLSDADLAGLLDELDELDAVPAADPMSLVPVAELPMAADASGGP